MLLLRVKIHEKTKMICSLEQKEVSERLESASVPCTGGGVDGYRGRRALCKMTVTAKVLTTELLLALQYCSSLGKAAK